MIYNTIKKYSDIIIISMVILLIYKITYFNINTVKIKSNFDSREYNVQEYENKTDAANLLARLRKKLCNLCIQLREEYPNNTSVQRLKKFNPDKVYEGFPDPESKNTSYSINKGEKLIFCLRSGEDENQLHDINLIMFVALHELAHIMSVSTGHNKEFYDNFTFILNKASEMGYYNPINYKKKPTEYCGMTVNTTPLF